MKKKFYSITGRTIAAAAMSLLTHGALAQAPAISWQRTLGGTNSEKSLCAQQTFEGGYIMCGYTASTDGSVTGNHGGTDAWVTKHSSSGAVTWQKALGGTFSESMNFIRQTADSGYIMAGYTASTNGDVSGNHGSNDFWVVKLTAAGVISWQKCYGGTSIDNAYSIRQTIDGGYIVAGFTQSTNIDVTANHGGADAWVVKLSATGAIDWQKCLGGTNDDYAFDIIQSSDTGYLVAGHSKSSNGDLTANNGNSDVWVVKLSSTGAIQWKKSAGGSDVDVAYACTQLSDGSYAVAGSTSSNNGDVTSQKGNGDFWVIKFSATGSIVWQKTLGGSSVEEARSIAPTAAGGMIVTGSSSSNDTDVTGNHGGADVWVAKLSQSGGLQWQKSYGGTDIDEAYNISGTADGGYYIAGASRSSDGDLSSGTGGYDFWAVKLDACTPPAPSITVTGTTLTTTIAYDTYQWLLAGTPIAGATAASYVATVSGDYKVAVTNNYGCASLSAAQTVTIPPSGVNNTAMQAAGIRIFPNPANGSFTVSLPQSDNDLYVSVTDMLGKTIASQQFTGSAANTAVFSTNDLATGNYIVRITDGNNTYREKLVVIK